MGGSVTIHILLHPQVWGYPQGWHFAVMELMVMKEERKETVGRGKEGKKGRKEGNAPMGMMVVIKEKAAALICGKRSVGGKRGKEWREGKCAKN